MSLTKLSWLTPTGPRRPANDCANPWVAMISNVPALRSSIENTARSAPTTAGAAAVGEHVPDESRQGRQREHDRAGAELRRGGLDETSHRDVEVLSAQDVGDGGSEGLVPALEVEQAGIDVLVGAGGSLRGRPQRRPPARHGSSSARSA